MDKRRGPKGSAAVPIAASGETAGWSSLRLKAEAQGGREPPVGAECTTSNVSVGMSGATEGNKAK